MEEKIMRVAEHFSTLRETRKVEMSLEEFRR
jgi:hypothetical protein